MWADNNSFYTEMHNKSQFYERKVLNDKISLKFFNGVS